MHSTVQGPNLYGLRVEFAEDDKKARAALEPLMAQMSRVAAIAPLGVEQDIKDISTKEKRCIKFAEAWPLT